MTNILLLILLPLLSFASEKDFLAEETPEMQMFIVKSFETFQQTRVGLIPLIKSESAPVLLIQGLDNNGFYDEWIKPLSLLRQKNINSSYFAWPKSHSVNYSKKRLQVVIKQLLLKYPNDKLTIMGYSTGGVLALLSLIEMDPELIKRVIFHSMASPFFGYGAPVVAYAGAPFVGIATIEFGRGFEKELQNISGFSCTHWVTTTCELDKHACENSGVFPQTGLKTPGETMPCGLKNTRTLPKESHTSVINRVFQDVFN